MSRLAFGGGYGGGLGKYVFSPLKFAASGNVFYCPFTGIASANEVGEGLGLAAADRTLTQQGGVAGAVDGWRTMTNTQRFDATVGLINAAVHSAAGFAMAWHFRNANYTIGVDNVYLMYGGTVGSGDIGHISMNENTQGVNKTWGYNTYSNVSGITDGWYLNYTYTRTKLLPEDGEWYQYVSCNQADKLLMIGLAYGAEPPKTLADFDVLQISVDTIVSTAADYTTAAKSLVGRNTAMDVGAVLVSNQPVISLRS